MGAGFQAAESKGRVRGKGGSLFLGKAPLTTAAPGDCPLPWTTLPYAVLATHYALSKFSTLKSLLCVRHCANKHTHKKK